MPDLTPITEETTVRDVFSFSDAIHEAMDEEARKTYELLDSLSEEVAKESKKWEDKLPYHINLLDILSPDEPQHSKILSHVLRFKTPAGEYEILKSLIAYIQSRYGIFAGIKVEKPCIDPEYGRIDIYVRESGRYAIIIENKSNAAGDQPNQLARYIKRVEADGYTDEQIYVLYTPQEAWREPADHSWTTPPDDPDCPGVSLKGKFQDRYVNFSFRVGILPWLKESVLPNVRHKDTHLSSALAQYIDHWDGQCGLRNNEKEKHMSMETVVLKRLEISTDTSGITQFGAFVEKVMKKRREFDVVTTCLANLEQKFRNDIFEDTIKDLHDVDVFVNREMTLNIDPSRPWQQIQRPEWIKSALNVHFEYEMSANNLSGNLKMMVDVEWRDSEQFLRLFSDSIFPQIKKEYSQKEIKFRPKNRKQALAFKEYPCDGDSLDEKIKSRKKVVLEAWNEFSFLIPYIDATFQLFANVSQKEQKS
jgi:hypothetical protein